MIITTIQDANAANCCPCDWPVCAAPRKESETPPDCGYFAGDGTLFQTWGDYEYGTDGLPDPEFRKLFKTVTITILISQTITGEGGYGFDDYTESITGNYVKEFNRELDESLDCIYSESGAASWARGYSGSYDSTPADPYLISYSMSGSGVISGGSNTNGSGSETYTYSTYSDTNSNGFVDTIASIGAYISDSWDGSVWTMLKDHGSVEIAYSDPFDLLERYRFGVPDGYSTLEVPRSTWEMTWDEMFASAAWWAWYDGGMEGAAPDASLALVTARDWTWAGDMEEPWSDWYEISVPETPGETRVVNIMVICWRSTRLGYKPTYHGSQVALPE
jgi:hypothetical protein